MLNDSSYAARSAAILSLGQLRATRASQPLIRHLLSTKGPLGRWRIPVAEAKTNLADFLQWCGVFSYRRVYYPDVEDTRRDAASALGQIKGPEAVNALLEVLNNLARYPHNLVVEVVKALGESGDLAAVGPLISLIEKPPKEIKTGRTILYGGLATDGYIQPAAISSLGSLKDKRAVQPLLNLYFKIEKEVNDNRRSPRVRPGSRSGSTRILWIASFEWLKNPVARPAIRL